MAAIIIICTYKTELLKFAYKMLILIAVFTKTNSDKGKP